MTVGIFPLVTEDRIENNALSSENAKPGVHDIFRAAHMNVTVVLGSFSYCAQIALLRSEST